MKQGVTTQQLSQGKYTQLKLVYDAFYDKPRTMKEVFVLTGVLREFVCWHCRALREENRLFFIRKRRCTITGENVNEYTSDPSKAPVDNQLNLFQ